MLTVSQYLDNMGYHFVVLLSHRFNPVDQIVKYRGECRPVEKMMSCDATLLRH